jgi:hypothetical protein
MGEQKTRLWHWLCFIKCQQQEKQLTFLVVVQMKIYRTHRRSRLPWLFGLVLFALVMSITTSDVYGFSNTPKSNKNGKIENRNNRSDKDKKNEHNRGNDHNGRGGKNDNDNPPQVPEPATMILLGSGLAAAYALKRKTN